MNPTLANHIPQELLNNPDFINRYADRMQARQQEAQARQQQAKAATPQRGRGGILSSLISETGGGLGAAGGAAAGAAIGSVVPVLGTAVGGLIGAGLGGFLGGTGGRAIENKVRDNQNFFGAGGSAKAAFGEGALSGALSVGSEALQLAKAGKAITGARTLLHPIENIGAGIAEKNAGRAYMGGIETVGKSLKAGGMGMAQGASAPGVEAIGAKASDDLVAAVTKGFNIRVGSPESVQAALEPKLAKLSQDLSLKYTNANVALTAQEVNRLGTSILDKAVSQGGLSGDAGRNFALEEAHKITKLKDVKSLWEYAKELDSTINFNRSSGAAEPGHEAVANIIRERIRPFLNGKVEGIAADNNLYHQALDANKLLIKASANSRGGNLTSKLFSLAPVKSAEAKTGALIENIGRGVSGTGQGALTKPLSQISNQLLRQSPGAIGRGVYGMANQQMQPTDQPQDPNQPPTAMQDPTQPTDIMQTNSDGSYSPTYTGNTTDSFSMNNSQQPSQAPQSQYSLQQAIRDYQAAPTAKVQQQVMAYYDFVSKAEAAQVKAANNNNNNGLPSNVGKLSAKDYGLAQQGSRGLDELNQIIKNDPGVIGRSNTPGRGLPIIGGYIGKASGMTEFDTTGFAAISSLLRAQSGAAVPDSEVRSYMQHYLPRAGDTPQAVQRKIAQIRYNFRTVLQLGGSTSSTPDTPSALGEAL